ncbi:DUF1003 domain-containing protein, partial [Pseudonocardia oceani]
RLGRRRPHGRDTGMSHPRLSAPRKHGGAPPEHPVVTRMREHRTADLQLRMADAITRFAGSMRFVWLHAAAFAVWMLVAESNPWPTLTLVVSLEAIFLSTFVMIGQNRQAAFAKAKADHDFEAETLELRRNTELTREVHRLTVEVHRRVVDGPPR